MCKWPVKPLQVIAELLKQRSEFLVVADIGCGEGLLASMVPQKVYCFDLQKLNNHVIICDAAKVHMKLEPCSVDVCVFCLSLMGTNFTDFLRSANGVLKEGGTLLVAEVSSRFEVVLKSKRVKKRKKTINDTKPFVDSMVNFGYELVCEKSFDYFVFFEFQKGAKSNDSLFLNEITLKPCLYKKR